MYQPYPTGAQMPTLQRPPIPPQVANAVKVMYVGAATSIIGIIIDIVTINATKSHREEIPRSTTSRHALAQRLRRRGLPGPHRRQRRVPCRPPGPGR